MKVTVILNGIALLAIYAYTVNCLKSKLDSCSNQHVHGNYTARYHHGHKIAKALTAFSSHRQRSIFGCRDLCVEDDQCHSLRYTRAAAQSTNCWLYSNPSIKEFLLQDHKSSVISFLPKRCEDSGAVNGAWTPWAKDPQCNEPCPQLRQTQARVCSNPAPDCNGMSCTGQDNRTSQCLQDECRQPSQLKDITDTGVYYVQLSDRRVPLFIEIDPNGVAWTHIQRRLDGTVDFYRDWDVYKYGFGNVEHEFWLGNENIYELTKEGDQMIRFDLFDGENTTYADYEHFRLSGPSDHFRLHVSGYSGNAKDSFTHHDQMQFSTKDRKHDTAPNNEHCAVDFTGAWWYNHCLSSNLNGQYLNGVTTQYAKGIVWYSWKGHFFSLLKTVMKIRLRDPMQPA